jgi:signal transduction histidine kinase
VNVSPWDRLETILTAVAMVSAALGVVYGLALAIRWYNQPFLGLLTSEQLVVSDTRPVGDNLWQGFNAGIQPRDQILKLEELTGEKRSFTFKDVPNPGAVLNEALSTMHIGQNVSIEIFRPSKLYVPKVECSLYTSQGAQCTYPVQLLQIPFNDLFVQYIIGLLVAVVLLVIGGLIFRLRRHQSAPRLVTCLCAAMAYSVVGRFEMLTTYRTTIPWLFAMCMVGAVLFELALTFPYELAALRRRPIMRFIPLALGVAVAALSIRLYQIADAQNPQNYEFSQWLAVGLLGLGCLMLVVSLIGRRRSASPLLRDQAALALIGAAVSLSPIGLWIITQLLASDRLFSWTWIAFPFVFALPPLIVFPISITYALMQYRLIDTDRIISESLIYAALGVMLIIGYLLLTTAAYLFTWGLIRADNPLVIAVTLFIIAVLFTPARLRLEQAVDRAFFRQARLYEKRLEQFARSLTALVEMDDVIVRMQKEIDETLQPQYIFIFLRNISTGDYEAYIDPKTNKPQTDIHFTGDSSLVQMLGSQLTVLYMEPGQALPAELVAARLAVINTPVIIRLHSAKRLNGFIGLGPRQDNSRYQYEDLHFLEGLAEQAASAFERAQMIVEAQRNERELKVLAQVSAALNIVMDFDTLLEFIYTQADKVINAPNFFIALRERGQDELYYAFYQEEGERLPEKEGYRWRMGRDLLSDVVRSGQPINTDNYVTEMTRRDPRIHLENVPLRAWMGVPLNAGEGSALGCLALATTDPAITFTEDQIRIFWAIADLAATAIYKTRLFAETEERARQMKVLNDISSRLASEFEDLDALLQVITESAVEILRGEAGSLLLRDEGSGDLIFQLAVGGSGHDLVGSRIPAGSGIAGTVVQTGRHVIVNDTQQDTRWFGEVAKEAPAEPRKFATRAILAVPLTTRAGVIGVLEVINKKDGTPFVEDEVNLLTAFAGQAAVAIENARLFQMTDKALAERVTQLDNMQRIDQELNRTLDFNRVVDLTIDNAVRESGADAGALALVHLDPLGFEIVGSTGYPEEILQVGEYYPITLGIMGKVYRTTQPALITAVEMSSDRDYVQTLPGSKGQLAVPLVTRNIVTAVLLLETSHPDLFTMVTASFIQGLAEHANTAITNSQLFARLEEANSARTQFVGFVAHELKNPMASIKGYAEVLLGGMTGPLSEQQQNFVAVIRRNVVRMQQLVDDLRDLTAQETGNMTLKRGPVSIANVIVETLRPQQRAIDEKEQSVVSNYPETLPLVWGDELRLIQIMTNLVSNANKYTPANGTITILAEHVPNRWDPNGAPEVIHCAISDTGIGMSDVDLKKLFTAYWRSENPLAKEQPGTGLGMTLTRGLVEAHGGKIWVESTINVGTTFHFTVPLATEAEKVAPSQVRQ